MPHHCQLQCTTHDERGRYFAHSTGITYVFPRADDASLASKNRLLFAVLLLDSTDAPKQMFGMPMAVV